MKPVILLISISWLLFFCACEKKTESSDLRSVNSSLNYNINNKAAAMRLYSIMYKEDDDRSLERFKIVHISDAHLSSYSSSNNYKKPTNLLEAIKFSNQQELAINAIIATGDHISYAKKDEAELALASFYKNLFTNNNVPTFPCHGNHDSNMLSNEMSEYLTKSELNKLFDNKNNYTLSREQGENYYYADVKNPMGGTIRIIALDMLDQPFNEYATVSQALFSQKQVNWLCNTALKEKMTANHNIIILTHFPFESISASVKRYLIDGNFVHTSYMIPEIIEAFRTKKMIKEKYPNTINKNDTIFVNTDFTSYKGDFICYMGGHIHATTQFEITNIRNKSDAFSPQKMLLCTNMSPSEAGKVFNRVKREQDTVTDNSFCVYAIDTQERNIYITFFGAYLPSDMTKENYPEVQVISY